MPLYVQQPSDAALRRAMEGGYAPGGGVSVENAALTPYHADLAGLRFESLLVAPPVNANALTPSQRGDTLRYTASVLDASTGYTEQSVVVVDVGSGPANLAPVAGQETAPELVSDVGYESEIAVEPATVSDPGASGPVPLAELTAEELAAAGYYYLVQAPDGLYYDVPYEVVLEQRAAAGL